MSHERVTDAESHLEAYDNNFPPPTDPHERLRWAVSQRALLHATQADLLAEMEDVWHIEQVARGEIYGAE